MAIVAVVSIKVLYRLSLIPKSSIQLLPVKACCHSAEANNPVPIPAMEVTPPTANPGAVKSDIAAPPDINAGIVIKVNPIAVKALLSLATPPIVNPMPITAAIPKINDNIGKCPVGSTMLTGLLRQ